MLELVYSFPLFPFTSTHFHFTWASSLPYLTIARLLKDCKLCFRHYEFPPPKLKWYLSTSVSVKSHRLGLPYGDICRMGPYRNPFQKNKSLLHLALMDVLCSHSTFSSHTNMFIRRSCTIQLQICNSGRNMCSAVIKSTYMHELPKQLSCRSHPHLTVLTSGMPLLVSECEQQLICYYNQLRNTCQLYTHRRPDGFSIGNSFELSCFSNNSGKLSKSCMDLWFWLICTVLEEKSDLPRQDFHIVMPVSTLWRPS